MLQSLTGDDNLNTGGTLAQLSHQFDNLGNTRVPKFNELENWASKNESNPAVTDFNATLLGVSDEMGKILGGGVATDSSRAEARNILDASFANQQGKGAIASICGSMAQRQNAMVGKNVYLDKQYGKMANPQQAKPQATQTHVVPAGAIAGRDAQGNIIGYRTSDRKVVKF
jgi:fructose-specific component phosphotransferase system IIB-like protein